MEALLTTGVTVLPLPKELRLHQYVPVLLGGMQEIVDPGQALQDLPWPISEAHPAQIVLGGFGATGCPSLTHHPAARELRQVVYEALWPHFVRVFPGRKLEVLPDRFSIRRAGTTIGAESWHRDVGPKVPGDVIFGGWVNLDPPGSPAQKFSCIPGNVLASDVDPRGFAKFEKSDYPALEAAFKAVGPCAIPPGHIILFDQSIAHKITGSKASQTTYRQYFGWRITDAWSTAYDKAPFLEQQSMPPLPSGQIAPMYAKLHWVNWQDRLRDISTRFKPEYLEKEGPRAGCVYRELPGLVATGHAFAPYTIEETELFFPRLLIG